MIFPKYFADILFYFFGFVDLIICFKYTGFHISFDLYKVYEIRAAFETYNIPTFFVYVFSASIIVFPIVLVSSLKSKNYLKAFIAGIFQLLAYSADGRKSTLFILILSILFYFFVKKIELKVFPSALTSITFLGIIENKLFDTINLINLFIRRLFVIPSYLNYAYFDYFSTRPKDFFNQSILGKFGFKSVYLDKIPQIIGNHYYIDSYANNGLFSDAYFNLGTLGIVLMPFLIVIALKILDTASNGLEKSYCIGIIFVGSYTLLSSSFFTVMLTHGFIIGCIIMKLMVRRSNE